MIIVNAHTKNKHISRQFMYMADVWFEYDDQAFESQKNKYGDPYAFSNHPSQLVEYTDFIQMVHGAHLIVLFVNNAVDTPYKMYHKADLVIYHNSTSGTYNILEDRLGEHSSSIIYSAASIVRRLRDYNYGD